MKLSITTTGLEGIKKMIIDTAEEEVGHFALEVKINLGVFSPVGIRKSKGTESGRLQNSWDMDSKKTSKGVEWIIESSVEYASRQDREVLFHVDRDVLGKRSFADALPSKGKGDFKSPLKQLDYDRGYRFAVNEGEGSYYATHYMKKSMVEAGEKDINKVIEKAINRKLSVKYR